MKVELVWEKHSDMWALTISENRKRECLGAYLCEYDLWIIVQGHPIISSKKMKYLLKTSNLVHISILYPAYTKRFDQTELNWAIVFIDVQCFATRSWWLRTVSS